MIATAVDLSGMQPQQPEEKPQAPKGVYKTPVGSSYFKQPGDPAPAPAPRRSKPKKAPAPAPAPAPKHDDLAIAGRKQHQYLQRLKVGQLLWCAARTICRCLCSSRCFGRVLGTGRWSF